MIDVIDDSGVARAMLLRQIASTQIARTVAGGTRVRQIGRGPATPRGVAANWTVPNFTFKDVLTAVAGRSADTSAQKRIAASRALGQSGGQVQSAALRSRDRTTEAQYKEAPKRETTLDVPFADLITTAAEAYGVSPELVAAITKVESGFNPLAQSHAGAKGLMQLMDATARSLGVKNPFDPAENIEAGVRFLSSLLHRYNGDIKLALAAYNAGPGAVERYGGIPPYKETRNYVSRVLSYWQQFGGETV